MKTFFRPPTAFGGKALNFNIPAVQTEPQLVPSSAPSHFSQGTQPGIPLYCHFTSGDQLPEMYIGGK